MITGVVGSPIERTWLLRELQDDGVGGTDFQLAGDEELSAA